MNIGDTISRSWRLYRLNFSQFILYALIPTVILLLAKLLMNLPYTMLDNKTGMQITTCLCCPSGVMLFVFGLFVSTFFNLALAKAFYNNVSGQSIEYKDVFNYIKNNLSQILILSGILLLEIISFLIIDVILFFILYMISAIPTAFTVGLLSNLPQLGSISCIVFVVFFIGSAIIFFAVVAIQFMFISLQIVILATERPYLPYCIGKSIKIIINNPLRCILFAFCLIGLWYCLALFFEYPIIIGISVASIGSSIVPEDYFPAIYLIVSAIWTSVVNTLLWPLIVSSINTFYYDIRIRTEGLDLHHMLNAQKDQERRQAVNKLI